MHDNPMLMKITDRDPDKAFKKAMKETPVRDFIGDLIEWAYIGCTAPYNFLFVMPRLDRITQSILQQALSDGFEVGEPKPDFVYSRISTNLSARFYVEDAYITARLFNSHKFLEDLGREDCGHPVTESYYQAGKRSFEFGLVGTYEFEENRLGHRVSRRYPETMLKVIQEKDESGGFSLNHAHTVSMKGIIRMQLIVAPFFKNSINIKRYPLFKTGPKGKYADMINDYMRGYVEEALEHIVPPSFARLALSNDPAKRDKKYNGTGLTLTELVIKDSSGSELYSERLR